jgi:hypothetical protein
MIFIIILTKNKKYSKIKRFLKSKLKINKKTNKKYNYSTSHVNK